MGAEGGAESSSDNCGFITDTILHLQRVIPVGGKREDTALA
jgi:hypothetical protein